MAATIAPTAAAAPVHGLPPELMLDILEDLSRMDSAVDITNALCVCKTWEKLGTSLLWTNVVINNDNILPFVRSLTIARGHIGGRVQNLSILLKPIPSYAGHFSRTNKELDFPPNWDDYKLEEDTARRVFHLPSYLLTIEGAGMASFSKGASACNVYLVVASITLATLMKEKL